jgi:hypothetical protein
MAAMALLGAFCPFTPSLGAELAADSRFLAVGEPAVLTLTDDGGVGIGGAQLTALYRPESEVSVEEVVGLTDSTGVIADWVPKYPGIVELSASWVDSGADQSASATLSVRFPATPWRGVAVMIAAGVILYGGVVLSQLRLRRLE